MRFKSVRSLPMVVLSAAGLMGQEAKYPPMSEYKMDRDAEIALATSAAPKAISDRATIKVLTESGYQTTREGDNGFVCMVMRGFTGAPTFTPVQIRAFLTYDAKTRAPICLNPQAVRIVLPYYELRTKLGMEGKTAEQIAEAVQAAYAKGEIPKRTEASFAYMWSADQVLGPARPWHPHMMLYLPNYENSMLGANAQSSDLPTVGDDAGTPFAVALIPVDGKLAIKAQP
jgi:hypothetical protein